MTFPHRTSISTLAIAAISVLLLSWSQPAQAQSKRKKIEAAPDTTALFQGVAVSVDLLGPVQRAVSDYGQYEAALRINLKGKYFPVFELGLGSADGRDDATTLHYKTTAPYGRIGCDFNLLKNKHDIYRLYGGVRYAYTSYKFDLDGAPVTDPVWGGATPYEAYGEKCSFQWAEALIGVDAKIWGPIRLGWSLRYKRRLLHSEAGVGNSWYVPGFGKQGGSRFGGTFNIAFEL